MIKNLLRAVGGTMRRGKPFYFSSHEITQHFLPALFGVAPVVSSCPPCAVPLATCCSWLIGTGFPADKNPKFFWGPQHKPPPKKRRGRTKEMIRILDRGHPIIHLIVGSFDFLFTVGGIKGNHFDHRKKELYR